MTQSSQHIALLTSMGWKVTTASCGIPPKETEHSRIHGYDYLPELTLDLMASVERTMDRPTMDTYRAFLILIVGSVPRHNDWEMLDLAICATKEQRREAYLRVKGLWTP